MRQLLVGLVVICALFFVAQVVKADIVAFDSLSVPDTSWWDYTTQQYLYADFGVGYSIGYNPCAISEWGDHITVDPDAVGKKLTTARFLIREFNGQGSWSNQFPGIDSTGYDWPFTVNIYSYGPSQVLGGKTVSGATLLGSVTQTVHVAWKNTSLAYRAITMATIDLSSLNITCPGDLVYGITYDSYVGGYNPYGYSTPADGTNILDGASYNTNGTSGGFVYNSDGTRVFPVGDDVDREAYFMAPAYSMCWPDHPQGQFYEWNSLNYHTPDYPGYPYLGDWMDYPGFQLSVQGGEEPPAVPEPATVALLGLGVLGCLIRRK